MKIVFATNNSHKLAEVSAILGPGWELVTPASLGITEDIPETGDTLEDNALQKARYLYERINGERSDGVTESVVGVPTFADDTGLEVAALGGAPGVRSARYAGDRHDFDDNNRLLLRNLEGAADRSARFRTVIALIIDGREHLFEGRVEGRIVDGYRGTEGFGYDPIFAPAGSTATFAEMPPEEKNAMSHRARAVEKLARFLKINYEL
ncbi:MAG: RdgB/HAM1 family non-canonical purine NTP pyrophosphatase [Alistipes sp.]|jgi:XTP/dITP diphosphohydrolase|nr:RdgB/HAM1 family non-canonical purine NTP pyrophosphatase [Alistipes sp.]